MLRIWGVDGVGGDESLGLGGEGGEGAFLLETLAVGAAAFGVFGRSLSSHLEDVLVEDFDDSSDMLDLELLWQSG